jgi:hypothetical protein
MDKCCLLFCPSLSYFGILQHSICNMSKVCRSDQMPIQIIVGLCYYTKVLWWKFIKKTQVWSHKWFTVSVHRTLYPNQNIPYKIRILRHKKRTIKRVLLRKDIFCPNYHLIIVIFKTDFFIVIKVLWTVYHQLPVFWYFYFSYYIPSFSIGNESLS